MQIEKSIFELFIKQKFDFKFVLFSIGQTLFGISALENEVGVAGV